MVALPGDWRWSCYLDMAGKRSPPNWLATDGLLAQFAADRQETVRCYETFVSEDRNQGIVAAYATGEYSYQQIADFYGLHFTTIGKILRKARASQWSNVLGANGHLASNIDLPLVYLIFRDKVKNYLLTI